MDNRIPAPILELLCKKFQQSGYHTVAEFVRAKSVLSLETYTTVLLRHLRVHPRTLLIMMIELGCSIEEIREMLRNHMGKGDAVISKLLDSVEVSPVERELLKLYRRVCSDSPRKARLAFDLLETL